MDRVPVVLLLSDLTALLIACFVASAPPVASVVLVIGVVGMLHANQLYESRLTLSLIDDVPVLSSALCVVAAITAVVIVAETGVSLGSALALLALAFVLLMAARGAAYAVIRLARRKGWVAHRTLIVGTGPTAQRVARTLAKHPEHGLRVVGFIGPRLDMANAVVDSIVGEDAAQLARITAQHDVDVVIVTHVGAGGVLKSLRLRDAQTRCSVYLVPPLFQMLHTPRRDRIRDVALIKLRSTVARLWFWRLKRLMDVGVSLFALVALSPVLLLTAGLVWLEMGPQILFKQTRVGHRGRLFQLYKFRSLRPENVTEGATNWSISKDVRVGPIGRFIRRTSLDELPQLVNILRGDMSLVGPRPERPFFVEKFGREHDAYPLRHRVRPGLTGWAAVNGLRGDTSIEERAYFDNVYIDNWSLWLDVKIIACTFWSVVRGLGS